MASVHFARLVGREGSLRVVVAKRLHRQFLETPEFKQMFLDEARLAARVRHPNVVPILDVLSDAEELVLFMEYVHGPSLHALLRLTEGEPFPIAIAGVSRRTTSPHVAVRTKRKSPLPRRLSTL